MNKITTFELCHCLSSPFCLQPEAISTFTSDAALVSFAKYFCEASENMKNVSRSKITVYGQNADYS